MSDFSPRFLLAARMTDWDLLLRDTGEYCVYGVLTQVLTAAKTPSAAAAATAGIANVNAFHGRVAISACNKTLLASV